MMAWKLTPDNTEIVELVRRHVRGPYRFVHHALVPYVRVGPATEDEPITLTPGPHFCLPKAQSETLRGLAQTRDFAVLFERGQVILQAVGMLPTRQSAAKMLLDNLEQSRTSNAQHTIPPLTMERLEKTKPTELLSEICLREDVHPEYGDYLVIPETSVHAIEPLPSWAVKSVYVDDVYVVKPRLGVDKPIGQRPSA